MNSKAKLESSKAYYANHKESICANRRGRYILAEPKPDVREMYVKEIQSHLLNNSEARVELITVFKKQHPTVVKQMPRVMGKTVCRIAAKRLLNKALQVRKQHARSLLNNIGSIKTLQITGREDFGEGCHTTPEPYP